MQVLSCSSHSVGTRLAGLAAGSRKGSPTSKPRSQLPSPQPGTDGRQSQTPPPWSSLLLGVFLEVCCLVRFGEDDAEGVCLQSWSDTTAGGEDAKDQPLARAVNTGACTHAHTGDNTHGHMHTHPRSRPSWVTALVEFQPTSALQGPGCPRLWREEWEQAPSLALSTCLVLWRPAACAAGLVTPGCPLHINMPCVRYLYHLALSWLTDCQRRTFFISFCFSEAKGPLVPLRCLQVQSVSLTKARWSSKVPLELQ